MLSLYVYVIDTIKINFVHNFTPLRVTTFPYCIPSRKQILHNGKSIGNNKIHQKMIRIIFPLLSLFSKLTMAVTFFFVCLAGRPQKLETRSKNKKTISKERPHYRTLQLWTPHIWMFYYYSFLAIFSHVC